MICDQQPEFDPELSLSVARQWLGDQVAHIRGKTRTFCRNAGQLTARPALPAAFAAPEFPQLELHAPAG